MMYWLYPHLSLFWLVFWPGQALSAPVNPIPGGKLPEGKQWSTYDGFLDPIDVIADTSQKPDAVNLTVALQAMTYISRTWLADNRITKNDTSATFVLNKLIGDGPQQTDTSISIPTDLSALDGKIYSQIAAWPQGFAMGAGNLQLLSVLLGSPTQEPAVVSVPEALHMVTGLETVCHYDAMKSGVVINDNFYASILLTSKGLRKPLIILAKKDLATKKDLPTEKRLQAGYSYTVLSFYPNSLLVLQPDSTPKYFNTSEIFDDIAEIWTLKDELVE